MLSMSKVIYFIKQTLGYPDVVIEKSDEDIELFIKMFTLTEFSKYVPDVAELGLDTTNPTYQIVGRPSVYVLQDPDGRDILNIVEVIPQEMDLYKYGYPWFPHISNGGADVADMLMQVDASETSRMFSRGDTTFRFYPPNKLRIYPIDTLSDGFMIRYERGHAEDLTSIPSEFQMEFLYMCLADVMRMCGNIRNKYQSISTPFGDVPLNTDLASRGEEIKNNIIEKLRQLPPNVLIYVG